jgi:hypothetical protein
MAAPAAPLDVVELETPPAPAEPAIGAGSEPQPKLQAETAATENDVQERRIESKRGIETSDWSGNLTIARHAGEHDTRCFGSISIELRSRCVDGCGVAKVSRGSIGSQSEMG